MICRCVGIAFLAFCWLTGLAQSKDPGDSVLFKKADEAFALGFKNTDSAMMMANEVLQRGKELKNDRVIANAYNAIGWIMMHKGYLDSSIGYLDRSWQLFSKLKNESDVIRISINISEVYTKQSKFTDALKFLVQADSLCLKDGNLLHHHTNVKRQLAVVYRELGDYQKSIDYFSQALAGFSELDQTYHYLSTSISLSILYRKMKMLDSSLSILQRCIALSKGKSVRPYQTAMVSEHLAETYFTLKKYPQALNHYMAAYEIFRAMGNKADEAFEAYSVGKTLAAMQQYNQAEKYLLTSFNISDTLKLTNYQWDASLELAELYKKTGDWKNAFHFIQKSTELKDTLDLAEQIQETNELKEKFETEKKEGEIALLTTKNELAAADNRRTRLLQYIFIILFVASVAIGWLLLNRSRMKKKLEAQLLRNQIGRDLHDDIGSALSSIDISSRIALVKKGDARAVNEQLEKIQQHARKTMDSMSDIVWSINPQNDNFESILMRMREFAAEMCEPLHIDLRFSAPEGIENVSMDSDTRKNLFLIYKEAVNNAVKYSGCTILSIRFERTDRDILNMAIIDNGTGFDEETVKRGNGLRNMQSRAEHLHAKLKVQSGNGAGTMIELKCPLKKMKLSP